MSDDVVSNSKYGLDWTLAEVRAFVSNCYDRDTNLSVLLGYSAGWMTGRLVAIMGKSSIQPYLADGWPETLERDRLKSIRVPFDENFDEAQICGEKPFKPLFEALDLEPPSRVGVVPIPIGGRAAMMIVGDLEGDDLGPLAKVAIAIGEQLEQLIRLTKTGGLPPEDDRIPDVPERILRASNKAASWVEDEIALALQAGSSVVSDAHISDPQFEEPDDDAGHPGSATRNHRATMQLLDDSGSMAFPRKTMRLEESSAPNLEEESDVRSTQELPLETERSSVATMSMRPHQEDLPEASRTTFGLPLTSPVVDVIPPKDISDASEATNTLMGGISVEAGLLADSMPRPIESSEASTTMPGGIDAPVIDKPSPPGAAIFRGRKKAKTVGKFVPTRSNAKKNVPIPKNGVPKKKKNEGKRSQSVVPVDNSSSEKLDKKPANERPPKRSGNDTNPHPPPKKLAHTSEPIEDDWADYFGESGVGDKINHNPPPLPTTRVDTFDGLDELDDIVKPPEENQLSELDPSVFDGLDDGLDDGPVDGIRRTGDHTQIPQQAMEALLGSGPSVVELQESFLLLDSRDRDTAFKAADEIAALGLQALDILEMMFPGRIFVDRYQYTMETLPPAERHSPVMSVLVRIGSAAAYLPVKFLDHKSLETRFYATLALAALDPTGYLDLLYERLFDKDLQIRAISKKIMVQHKGERNFNSIIDSLRDELEMGREDLRVEIAADLLAELRDRDSIALMIDMLGQYGTRTNQRVHGALQRLTLKSWSSPYEWKHWWTTAKEESRNNWLIDALDAPHEATRAQAYDEIQRIPGLNLNYHPDQPAKLRRRAQRELRGWYEDNQS